MRTARGIRWGVRMAIYIAVSLLAVLGLQLAPSEASAQTVQPDKISGVRFGDHGTFERAVLDISTSGIVPGTAPPFSYSYRQGDQVLRVNLPTVGATNTANGLGLGKAISRYYVVRAPGTTGASFVDFHLNGAASSVKVYKLDNPARIVVDVAPGGTTLYPKPAVSAGSVVTGPRAGALVGPGTFSVTGYGRPFEAQGVWRIKNSAGTVVRQGTYQTNDWTAMWGSFGFSASYPATLAGTSGRLEVGEFSPNTGAFVGTSTPLRFR